MELRQLRAFLEVANARHFGRAATALKITQPALTQRIQALERELGVQILTRSAREVRLTSAGEVLLPFARTMIQVEDRAMHELEDNVGGRAGRLRIAYLSHGDAETQGKIVSEFRQRYPSIAVETTSAHSQANIKRVSEGDVDAAFLTLPIDSPEPVAVRSIGRYQLELALPQAHPLAVLERVPVRSLKGLPLVLSPMHLNPVLNTRLRNWLTSRTGGALNIVAEEPPDQAVEAVLNSGAALALINGRLSPTGNRASVVYRSLTPTPAVELAIAYLREDPSPALASLLAVIDEVPSTGLAEMPEDSEAI